LKRERRLNIEASSCAFETEERSSTFSQPFLEVHEAEQDHAGMFSCFTAFDQREHGTPSSGLEASKVEVIERETRRQIIMHRTLIFEPEAQNIASLISRFWTLRSLNKTENMKSANSILRTFDRRRTEYSSF
jgi:hypothetical protein